MNMPLINKRVLVFMDDEKSYPFVGYHDGCNWCIDTKYLDWDVCEEYVYGKVDSWAEIPEDLEKNIII